MKIDIKDPPRRFAVGNSEKFDMSDCANLSLEPDEQVTLTTPAGGEYDVARKSWGFYATPSLNGRLPQYGLRAVLIKNLGTLRFFVLLVEQACEADFDAYCAQENLAVISWLDSAENLSFLESALEAARAG